MTRLDFNLPQIAGTRASVRSLSGEDIAHLIRRESRWKVRALDDIPGWVIAVVESPRGLVLWSSDTPQRLAKGMAVHLKWPALTKAAE